MGLSGQPSLDDVEAVLEAVVEGRISRDEADGWAVGWVKDDSLVWDQLTWWALDLLHGIDLPAGPSEGYLHDDDEIRDWLTEPRRRMASQA
jgi:hypothetical protein